MDSDVEVHERHQKSHSAFVTSVPHSLGIHPPGDPDNHGAVVAALVIGDRIVTRITAGGGDLARKRESW